MTYGITGEVRMSALSSFLTEQLQSHGWTQTDLADRAGIPSSTMSRILNDKIAEPELSTLARLAEALNTPLIHLISLTGFQVGEIGSIHEQQHRLSILLDSLPWLVPVIDQIAALSPEDREGILVYLETLDRRRKKGP